MRLGYSLLLSDYVKAEEADYEDCATFGLVCPACHEAIFKRIRPTVSGESHYFAHYKISPQVTERCELRVNAITQHQMNTAEIESRGQNLSVFMKHFQRALLVQQSEVYA